MTDEPSTPRILRAAAIVVAMGATLLTVPRVVAGRDARAWFDGDLATEDALARHVVHATLTQDRPVLYASGDERFDGQSAVAFYQMTLLGLGQILLDHPERRDDYLPAMRLAAARLARSCCRTRSTSTLAAAAREAPRAAPTSATSTWASGCFASSIRRPSSRRCTTG